MPPVTYAPANNNAGHEKLIIDFGPLVIIRKAVIAIPDNAARQNATVIVASSTNLIIKLSGISARTPIPVIKRPFV